ncbi:zinc finger MYND domain-containing protein [Sporobolomyces salmoneus]|uniref:zinc finger MYND domain-containing protein n=1 Tax=Sporobolomyces salmoneus TaxID=183962 RepID=UPI0031730939
MSASQPSDSSGDCVVCGKRCWTRCAACGANGTEWMYFCSTDHQRLVWSVHKRFCGVNSSPLVWPLLSDSEADEAREVCRNLRQEQSRTSARAEKLEGLGFVKAKGIGLVKLESILPHILQNSDPSFKISKNDRSNHVAIFRRKMFDVKVNLAKYRNSPTRRGREELTLEAQETARDPIGYTLQQPDVAQEAWSLPDTDSPNSPWRDTLLHKILILFALLACYYTEPSRYDELLPFLKYARDEAERYCELVVYTHNPELALSVKESLTSEDFW